MQQFFIKVWLVMHHTVTVWFLWHQCCLFDGRAYFSEIWIHCSFY